MTEAATGANQTADNTAQGTLFANDVAAQNLKAAESELTDALNKVQEAEKELTTMPNQPIIDAATGQPQTPQPTDANGAPIPTPQTPVDAANTAAATTAAQTAPVPSTADPLASGADALPAAAPVVASGTATSAAPAPLTTPDPLTLEQFCRQNAGALTAAVQINDAGDVMLVFTGTDGMPAKIFAIMGELANNVTQLKA